jgi:hypothetical protein
VYSNGTFNTTSSVLKGPGDDKSIDPYYHPIIFNAGTQSPLVHNVTLINAGQQFIKSNLNLRRR